MSSLPTSLIPANTGTMPAPVDMMNGLVNSPFGSIPPEMREEIYKHVFTRNFPIVIFEYAGADHKPRVHVNLLRTCRQINIEASKLVYKLNSLRISLKRWTDSSRYPLKYTIAHKPALWPYDDDDDVNWAFIENFIYPLCNVVSGIGKSNAALLGSINLSPASGGFWILNKHELRLLIKLQKLLPACKLGAEVNVLGTRHIVSLDDPVPTFEEIAKMQSPTLDRCFASVPQVKLLMEEFRVQEKNDYA